MIINIIPDSNQATPEETKRITTPELNASIPQSLVDNNNKYPKMVFSVNNYYKTPHHSVASKTKKINRHLLFVKQFGEAATQGDRKQSQSILRERNEENMIINPLKKAYSRDYDANKMVLPSVRSSLMRRRQGISIQPDCALKCTETDTSKENLILRFNRLDTSPNNGENTSDKKIHPNKIVNFMKQIKSLLVTFANGNFGLSLIFGTTLCALFFPDIYTLLQAPESIDPVFNIFISICTFLFIIDNVVNVLSMHNFIFSILFWFDISATLSMFLEIIWIPSSFFNSISPKSIKKYLPYSQTSRKEMEEFYYNLVRIIRVLRIIKLYKVYYAHKINVDKKEKLENAQKMLIEETKLEEKDHKEQKKYLQVHNKAKQCRKLSQLIKQEDELHPGKEEGSGIKKVETIYAKSLEKLVNANRNIDIPERQINKVVSESITKKIIIMIIVFLTVTPWMDADKLCQWDTDQNYFFTCKLIEKYAKSFLQFNILEHFILNHTDMLYPILRVENLSDVLYDNINPPFNTTNPRSIFQITSESGNITLYYLASRNQFVFSLINLFRLIFAIILLFIMVHFLEKDSKNTVLKPLEALIDTVENVAKDPVNHKIIARIQNKTTKGFKNYKTFNTRMQKFKGAQYEMRVIENSIIKISALLAIVYGEAGGEILKENLGSHQELNPMLEGRKIAAIFGFCDIRQFEAINIALQEETIIFVNEIAEIVHASVNRFSGVVNKNIGESFLLAWKLPASELNAITGKVEPVIDSKLNQFYADSSVLAFLNIIKKINKSPVILKYWHQPKIRQLLGNQFKVSMGFGLHVGWAIEGAIGSLYKIDCSYLSPNVNASARLETATRQFGVSLLLSESVHNLLSPALKKICKMIDVVTLKGSQNSIKLFTVHVNLKLKMGKKKRQLSLKEKREKYHLQRSALYSSYAHLGTLEQVIMKDSFYHLLIDKRSLFFHKRFNEGLEAYIAGDWKESEKCLSQAAYLDPTDGPTKTIRDFICTYNYKAPDDWKGYRVLVNK